MVVAPAGVFIAELDEDATGVVTSPMYTLI
jgi:hypothetical protein